MSIQVSQGNVETLFRWGGKRLHHFAANLFRKRCAEFHQNRWSFIGDITKKHFGLFFGRTVYAYTITVSSVSDGIYVMAVYAWFTPFLYHIILFEHDDLGSAINFTVTHWSYFD